MKRYAVFFVTHMDGCKEAAGFSLIEAKDSFAAFEKSLSEHNIAQKDVWFSKVVSAEDLNGTKP